MISATVSATPEKFRKPRAVSLSGHMMPLLFLEPVRREFECTAVFFYSGIGNLVDGLIFAKHIYLIISRAGWTGAKRKIAGRKIDLNPI
jgi:hypothetical protein